jgi:similar to stage IV sporulation protein
MFLWGGFFFCLLLYLMSSFIWFVEVKSDRPLHYVTPNEILAAAEQEGLYRGAFKGNNLLTGMADRISNRIPQLAWVVINVKGTRATIEVVEQILPPRTEEANNPANLVAAKDGVVKELLVLSGEGRVVENQTVRQGEVLISGIIQPKPLPGSAEAKEKGLSPVLPDPKYVRARGLVRARVWYEEESMVPMVLVQRQLTGASVKTVVICWGGKEIQVIGPKAISYAYYKKEQKKQTIIPTRWRNWRILNAPVEMVTTAFSEIQTTRQYLGPEKAGQMAEAEATKLVAAKIPTQAKVVDRKAEIISRDNQEVRVRVIVETLEEIGQLQTIPVEP